MIVLVFACRISDDLVPFEQALECPPMHVQGSSRLRYVFVHFMEDMRDMLFAGVFGHDWVCWSRGMFVSRPDERIYDFVGCCRLGNVVDGADTRCRNGSRNIPVGGENNCADVWIAFLKHLYKGQATAVLQTQIDDRIARQFGIGLIHCI